MDTASGRRRTGSARAAMMVGVACCLLGGCKSGSWMSKPSWWTFGGSADASKLASAPAYDGVAKPSASAQPYPTTATPEGYSLADAAGTTGDGGTQPAAAPPAVTYGTKPPTTTAPTAGAYAAPAATAATTATLPAPATGLSTISPQVGPYAALPPDTRPAGIAAMPPAGSTETPAAATLPASPRSEIAGARVADARPGDSWPATIPAPGADSRYGTGSGSRFGSPPDALAPAQAIDALPSAAPVSPPLPAAVAPAAAALAPSGLVPPAAVVPPAATAPDGTPPIPARRPDRGYRPGGTSSYRPSRSLLNDEPAPPGSEVQPASFAAPVENAR